jgi:3-oxoacyl-[acyl-carrier protein] reductase
VGGHQQFLRIVRRAKAVRPVSEVTLGQGGRRHVPDFPEAGLPCLDQSAAAVTGLFARSAPGFTRTIAGHHSTGFLGDGMTNGQRGGRVALVTGASRGIGAAIARLLASRGMQVAVNYRSSHDEADEVVASIGSAGGRAMAVRADVRDGPAVLGMVEQVRAAMGEVEVLVHNALIPYAIKSFDEISWDELGGKLEQEMQAAFVMTKAVVPGMTKNGYGRIIYMGTVLSRRPREGMIALGTSKAALGSFARYVAEELGPRGITVNVVAPGPVAETNVEQSALDQEQRQRQAEQTALGRIASPEDVARAVAIYASDDSEFITGTTAPVNGGLAMD